MLMSSSIYSKHGVASIKLTTLILEILDLLNHWVSIGWIKIEPHTTRHLFNCKKKKNSDTTIPLRIPNQSCELPRNNRLQRGNSLTEGNNNNMRKIDINSQVVKIH